MYTYFDYLKIRAILSHLIPGVYSLPELTYHDLETNGGGNLLIADIPYDANGEIDLICVMVKDRDREESTFGFIMHESSCEVGIMSGHLPNEPEIGMTRYDNYREAISKFLGLLEEYQARILNN